MEDRATDSPPPTPPPRRVVSRRVSRCAAQATAPRSDRRRGRIPRHVFVVRRASFRSLGGELGAGGFPGRLPVFLVARRRRRPRPFPRTHVVIPAIVVADEIDYASPGAFLLSRRLSRRRARRSATLSRRALLLRIGFGLFLLLSPTLFLKRGERGYVLEVHLFLSPRFAHGVAVNLASCGRRLHVTGGVRPRIRRGGRDELPEK